MELSRGEMKIDEDGVDDHWCMIMEKGKKKIRKICRFNKFQGHNLVEQSLH
jgi:hypothetical protein